MPTLAELAGAALTEGQPRDGASLVPVLRGEGDLPRENLFIHFEPRWPTARPARYAFDRRWKFFAIHLNDGSDLICVDVKERNGTQLNRFATHVPVSGAPQVISDPTVEELGTFSPQGYPLDNRLGSASQNLDIVVSAAFPDQRRTPTEGAALPFLTFWEGSCTVEDAGNPVGVAFTELGGYE